MLQSLAAWLELRADEQLWLEVSEDFSVQSANMTTDFQVKSSRAASGPTSYSLQSADVRAALHRFWERANENVDVDCRLTFIANGKASRERDHPFPDNIPGLLYWQRAAMDGDTAPIRAALSVLFCDEPLGAWVAENPSDAELRQRLLRRVQWALEAASSDGLADQLRDQVGNIYLTKNLPAIAADEAVRALLDRVFETACRASPQERKLMRIDLHRVIEETAAAITLGQTMARPSAAADAGETIQSVLVTEVEGAPGTFTQRVETVTEVLGSTRGETVIWLHGSHGVGKSTLAKLMAQRIGGRWIALDLRPVQKDATACLAAWRALVRASMGGTAPDGVIIDDLGGSAPGALRPRIVALAQTFAGRGARVIITSPQAPSPARFLELGSSAGAAVQSPYFSEAEVLELVAGPGAPPEDMQKAWAVFIRAGASGGHPLLTAAKVVSLRVRKWPAIALTEDFGPKTSEAVRATRDDARQQLLRELSSLDEARSIDAGKVLRRIACVFDRVDDALARKLTAADPAIANAGDALAVLRGTWLEMLPVGDFRISPLLGDLVGDVPPDDVTRWRQIAAVHWLGTGVLDERTLPLCFWNAFLGKHTWVLFKLCEVLQTLPHERLVGAAALLSPMTVLVTDRSLYPDNPTLAAQLRLLQFEVADAMEQEKLAAKIATRLLVEIDQVPIDDIKSLLTTVAAQKVLMAKFGETSPEDRLEFALRFRREMPRVIAISGGSVADPSEEILREFGPRVDMAGLFFAGRMEQIRSSEDFLALVQALDKLSPDDRNSFIDAADIVFEGLSAFAHSGWLRDELGNRQMTEAQRCYEDIDAIARGWNRPDLMVALACARSVIQDEGMNDTEMAMSVIDSASSSLGYQPALVRQKSKVLGHAGRDEEAARLLITVEDEVGASSPFDRALALREGGVSAARAHLFTDAIRLFAKASDALSARTGVDALKAGLVTEQALALWEVGERGAALATLGNAFDLLETVAVTGTRQGERAHQVARAAAGLFMHDCRSFPRDPRPTIPFGHASTLSTDHDELLNLDLKPLADNWRILALVEIETGVDAGIEQRSLAKQTKLGVLDIELLICCARYGRSLTSGLLPQTFRDGIASASALKVAQSTKAQPGSLARINRADLVSTPVETLLADSNWRETVLRIPVDVFLWNKFNREPQAGLLDRLARTCREAFGRDTVADSLMKATSGIYAVGPSAPLSVTTAAAIALSDEAVANDPETRFRRDMHLVGHLAQSMARRVLEPIVAPKIAAGWVVVLKDQRYALRAPTINCPDIEAAVASIGTSGLKGAARLILAAAPAVGYQLDAGWEELLMKVGAETSV